MNWFQKFTNPINEYKPKVRYWMPHGIVSDEGIKKDIADLYARGFGSIEVVCMENHVDPSCFTDDLRWGGDAWIDKMNVLLSEAKKYNMTVDFANGPGWPISDVTAKSVDKDTTLYELSFGLQTLNAGEKYRGEAPKPELTKEGTAKLIAVSLYKIVGKDLLDFSSYIALPVSNQVEFTVPDDGEEWVLFAFWGRPAGHMHHKYYVLDHFSENASKAIMDYWEEKIFPKWGDNLSVVSSLFCDSLEYKVDLEWTRTFVADFEQRKGYSIIPYLPVLGNEEILPDAKNWVEREKYCRGIKGDMHLRSFGTFPSTHICGYEFSDSALQHRVNYDYFEMITHLFCEKHIGYMQKRMDKYGINIRYQVAYNKTLEAETCALYPNIPENELLGSCIMDRPRNMSAAVHLDRKKVYSFECAAESFNQYGQTHEDVLWWAKRAYAGSMNAQVLHGGNYNGYYDGAGNVNGIAPGVDWPGFEGFGKRVWSNAWNRTLNIDEQNYIFSYLARCNFLLQAPHKMDIAMYLNRCAIRYDPFDDGYALYKDGDLLSDLGYTYEFLSPALLVHKNAVVTDGILDKEGAGYKALIVNNEEFMSLDTAKQIRRFADNGLLVVFIGQLPSKIRLQSEQKTDQELQAVWQGMKYLFAEDILDVPQLLKTNNILPDAMPKERCPLHPVHILHENAHFYYIYNATKVIKENNETFYPCINKEKYMQVADAEISLLGTGDVYEIDGFSGKCKKLPSKSQNGRTTAFVHFERDEAKILAVLTEEQAEQLGVCGQIENFVVSKEIQLDNWTLTINQITAPENRIATFYQSQWKVLPEVKLQKLLPWCEINGLPERVCGIGAYETVFEMAEIPPKAVLCLENVVDTYTVELNGQTISQGDPALKQTDISACVKQGENVLKIYVSSTLQNEANLDFLMEKEKKTGPQKYGITGNVVVKCYK